MMKFQCKNCSAKLQADESKVGQVFPCPKCAEQVVIPSPFVETTPEAPRTPPEPKMTPTRQMIHPDVWEIGKQAVAHLVALLVFAIIAQVYLNYRMEQVQANMSKHLESTQKPFDPSEMMTR